MHRLSGSKGQWFIISAVFISGIFLTISFMLSAFVPVDNSLIVYKNEDYFYNTIKIKADEILNNCNNGWKRDLTGFINTTRSYLKERGYLLEFDFPSDCNDYNLTIKTAEMRVKS